MIILCAGTYALGEATPAPVGVPHLKGQKAETVPCLCTAAHHTRTTAAMIGIGGMLETLAAPPARLSANQKYVPAMSHLPTSATTPTTTAEYWERMLTIPVRTVAVFR